MADQRRTFTVNETIHVRRPPEVVFESMRDGMAAAKAIMEAAPEPSEPA